MDDIYFSDKRKRRESGDNDYTPRKRFTQGEGYDIKENPSLRKRTPYNESYDDRDIYSLDFDVDEGFDFYDTPDLDRTPQGARKAPPSHSPARTPTGARMPQRQTPPVKRSTNPAPKRTPTGPRKKPDKAFLEKLDSPKKKIAAAIGAFLIVFFLGIFAYGYSVMGNINYDDTITKNAYIDESDLIHSSKVKNILIIGSDGREEVSGERADTMILLSIDKKHKQLKLTSFLRDSYVYIPSEGYKDKLNAAYSIGGAQLTMDTLEYNYEIEIDGYITINFEVFKQFINLIGGVPIDVQEYEAEYMVDELKYIYITPGVNVMNGNAALMYCRMRYLDDDFYRTQRQRKVIKAVVAKVAKTNLFKLMGIVKEVVPNIKTDISRNKLISLGAGAALKFLRYDIVQQQIPADGTWWNESVYGSGDVIAFDVDENAEILKDFVYEKVKEE